MIYKEFLRQKVLSYIFSKIPFSFLGRLARTNLIIPYYHMVSDNNIIHVKHLYRYKNIKQFNEDLDFLLRKFSPISLYDIMDFLKSNHSFFDNTFLLTFDDGFKEMHDIVAPILLEKGISATFFINSDFIDNKKLCYQHKVSILVEHFQNNLPLVSIKKANEIFSKNNIKVNDIRSGILSIKYHEKHIIDEIAQLWGIDFNSYLLGEKPYLTSDQINKLIKDGFTIGAHSIDHPLYSSLSLKEQLNQTETSVRFIRERFCLDYGAFAFPHNDNNVSRKFFEEIYSSGLIDVSFGTSDMRNDTFKNNVQRISLEKPFLSAERIISLQCAKKLFRVVKSSNKIIR